MHTRLNKNTRQRTALIYLRKLPRLHPFWQKALRRHEQPVSVCSRQMCRPQGVLYYLSHNGAKVLRTHTHTREHAHEYADADAHAHTSSDMLAFFCRKKITPTSYFRGLLVILYSRRAVTPQKRMTPEGAREQDRPYTNNQRANRRAIHDQSENKEVYGHDIVCGCLCAIDRV